MSTPEFGSPAAAATIAKVHAVTIYAWLKEGRVQCERDGRRIKVNMDSLRQFLLTRKSTEGEPALDRARGLVLGADEVHREPEPELEDDEDPELETSESDEEDAAAAEGVNRMHPDGTVTEENLDMAKRLVDHAVAMKRKRRKEAELELLWLAVQELGLAEPDEDAPPKRGQEPF